MSLWHRALDWFRPTETRTAYPCVGNEPGWAPAIGSRPIIKSGIVRDIPARGVVVADIVGLKAPISACDTAQTSDGGVVLEYTCTCSARVLSLVVPNDGATTYYVARSPLFRSAGIVRQDEAVAGLREWLTGAAFPVAGLEEG
jgi:hypothetical protein